MRNNNSDKFHFICIVFSSVIIVSLTFSSFLNAAPCEFPAFNLFPPIKFYEKGEKIYLYPEDKEDARTFRSREAYEINGKKGLIAIDKKEVSRNKELISNYIKPGDSFVIDEIKYTLLKFGIKKEQGNRIKILKIPGIQKDKLEKMLKYKPVEYEEAPANSKIIVSRIHIAIVLGNKLFAGFEGGFPEGIGMPGGVAVFDFSKDKWIVEWQHELLNLYVTDVVPVSPNSVFFSAKKGEEFFIFPTSIFEYDLKINTFKAREFSDIKPWALKRWQDVIFMIGPDGLTFYDVKDKQLQKYIWTIDVNSNGEIVAVLIKCSQSQCITKERDKQFLFYFISTIFEIKNKKDFMRWVNKSLANRNLKGYPHEYSWLPDPDTDCGYWIEMPEEFLRHVNVEQLLLLSEARKSPLVWKTLTNTIKLSKQASLYSPVILKAAKDPNEWIRNLATEAINALGLEEK